MEEVALQTADIAAENAAKLAELFPDIVTEVLDEDGNVRHSIDVEALKAHVGDIAEDKRERYQFTWPGKQKARAEAIRPISKTMCPAPEESVNWDSTENLYIEGDNLDALKILRETYAGKIKMIYIDPPYNTGHDFVYNDDFARSAEEERAESGAFDEAGNVLDAAYKVNNESNGKFHSDWCSMMYPRLVLARDLLSEDGVLLFSIGETEFASAAKILDEVFGTNNRLCTFVWKSRSKPTNAGSAVYRPQKVAEYILVYGVKNSEQYRLNVSSSESRQYPHVDSKGKYRLVTILTSNRGTFKRETMRFEAGGYTPSADYRWKAGKEKIDALFASGHIQFNADGAPMEKKYIDEEEAPAEPVYTLISENLSGTAESGKKELTGLIGNQHGFDTVKPTAIIKHLSRLFSSNKDLVLDFFSGSATTAHAVIQLNAEDGGNRKFIMVQLPEVCDGKSEAAKAGYKNICEIGKERIRRAGAKIVTEVEESNAQLKLGEEPKRVPDIGFRVLKIDSTNFEDVSRTPDMLFQDELFGLADNLKPDRTPEDILFELMPKFQIPYTARIDKFDICGKTVYSVDDDTLLACLDREVSEDVVRAMAGREPAYAVLRDASFVGDDALANFEEIFKTLSPATKTRVV